jgi:ribosomal protein S18 acetylase RimI-like enzyme
MKIESIQKEDLEHVRQLQPPDWDDIGIPHQQYITSTSCNPVKIVIDNKIAGIGTAIKHEDTAWLAHIIVRPEYRGKGVGKAITQALVDSVDKHRYKTIYLIATDLGFPVYQRIGFEQEADYIHLVSKTGARPLTVPSSILTYDKKYRNEIIELDKFVSGEDRQERFEGQFESARLLLSDAKVSGVYFPHLGNGLIIARNAIAGVELMKLRLEERDFAILPAANKPAIKFLLRNDFKQVRISKRMYMGKKRRWRPSAVYNRISGQFG